MKSKDLFLKDEHTTLKETFDKYKYVAGLAYMVWHQGNGSFHNLHCREPLCIYSSFPKLSSYLPVINKNKQIFCIEKNEVKDF